MAEALKATASQADIELLISNFQYEHMGNRAARLQDEPNATE